MASPSSSAVPWQTLRRMTSTIRTAILLCVFTQAIVGCGPTAPSPPPPGTGQLVVTRGGTVRNRAFLPVEGARVEVVDGRSAGATTTTDSRGVFVLTGVFNLTETIRVSKDGYSDATLNFTSPLDFVLEALAPPVDLAGAYIATLIADPSCPLPEELRTRTYHLTLTGYGVFSGAAFLPDHHEIATYKSGNQVVFSTEFHGEPLLVERIAENSYLGVHVVGNVVVETPITTISIPMSGSIQYCVNSPMSSSFQCSGNQAAPKCESQHHRLILDRR